MNREENQDTNANARVALEALKKFQEQMDGEAEKAGLYSEEDISELITFSRTKKQKAIPISDAEKKR